MRRIVHLIVVTIILSGCNRESIVYNDRKYNYVSTYNNYHLYKVELCAAGDAAELIKHVNGIYYFLPTNESHCYIFNFKGDIIKFDKAIETLTGPDLRMIEGLPVKISASPNIDSVINNG